MKNNADAGRVSRKKCYRAKKNYMNAIVKKSEKKPEKQHNGVKGAACRWKRIVWIIGELSHLLRRDSSLSFDIFPICRYCQDPFSFLNMHLSFSLELRRSFVCLHEIVLRICSIQALRCLGGKPRFWYYFLHRNMDSKRFHSIVQQEYLNRFLSVVAQYVLRKENLLKGNHALPLLQGDCRSTIWCWLTLADRNSFRPKLPNQLWRQECGEVVMRRKTKRGIFTWMSWGFMALELIMLLMK